MICFERADALHAHEKALRAIQVTDADTLCAYLKGFWEFIYNHKMFGCVYYFTGTNKAYSIYGAPTGQKLEGEKAINLSDFHVRKIDGEWLIVLERTMHPCDYIRAVCTGDTSFTKLEM